MMNANEFEEIRPYRDDELQYYLLEIINDKSFLKAVDYLFLSKRNRFLASIIRPFIKPYLRLKARSISSIDNFQLEYGKKVLEELLKRNTTAVVIGGKENLDTTKSYTFMSNHVDIVMDSAFLNYELYLLGFEKTLQIAIGDNLLDIKFVEHLSRLNKAFKVMRSIGVGRQALRVFMQLSSYIHYSIANGENIWIAQSEGRSKNNIFDTDLAIIKMFNLAKRDNSFADNINSLNILPVSISYEWDPCDILKAREIVLTRKTGSYQKAEFEDFDSIATGMKGYRGEVALYFGEKLHITDEATPEMVAETITNTIKSNYKVMSTTIASFELLGNAHLVADEYGYTREQIEATKNILQERVANIEPEIQKEILINYANPLIEQLKLKTNG